MRLPGGQSRRLVVVRLGFFISAWTCMLGRLFHEGQNEWSGRRTSNCHNEVQRIYICLERVVAQEIALEKVHAQPEDPKWCEQFFRRARRSVRVLRDPILHKRTKMGHAPVAAVVKKDIVSKLAWALGIGFGLALPFRYWHHQVLILRFSGPHTHSTIFMLNGSPHNNFTSLWPVSQHSVMLYSSEHCTHHIYTITALLPPNTNNIQRPSYIPTIS